MTFQERLQLFPPVLCRLMARSPGQPLPLSEDIIKSEWPVEDRIKRSTILTTVIDGYSHMTSWRGTDTLDAMHFMLGCGVDLTNGRAMVRHDDYLKKNPTFNYLRKSKQWDSYYLPLLVLWRKSYPVEPPAALWPPIRNLLVRLTPIIK